MLFEVGDGDFFVGLDGGSEALFCGLVEVVAAEDFFCVGGVYVKSGEFTMSGGTISGNKAPPGGGVYVESGEFTMSGGEISGNAAEYGAGGVFVVSSGEFTMSGGSISGNTGNVGGGVYVGGTFTMSGDAVISCNTGNVGGGVYVVSSGEFELSGSGSTDSVYLTSGKSITVTGELTGTGAQVRGIEFAVLDDGTTVVTGTPLQEDDLSRFELDSSVTGFKLAYQSSNIVLKVQPDCTVQFDAQGGSPKPADVTVPYGGMVTEPTETPVKTGYTFTCWYKEEECINQWDFDTDTVTGDITLYAGWEMHEPGPGPGPDPDPTPVPPSYSNGDGNMENAFRVLFNDGATTIAVETDLSYGDKLTKPEDPVKDGYTFAGWYKD